MEHRVSIITSLGQAHDPDYSGLIAFIGGGQMASALIAGLLRSGHDASTILVVEPHAPQRERLVNEYSVRVLPAPSSELAEATIVIWAVKPQVMRDAAVAARDWTTASLHVSIAAGISLATLQRWLAANRVVRVMPNTPALIGAGVTGLLAGPAVSEADRRFVESVFASTGHVLWVDSDEGVDAITAVSGSGPGYIFQFLASYQAGAEALGFSKEQARDLVLKTCAGAVQQAIAEPTALTTLRDRVASKGGTTEAGLAIMNRQGIDIVMKQSLDSAFRRAREMSEQLDQS